MLQRRKGVFEEELSMCKGLEEVVMASIFSKDGSTL